MNMDRLPFKLTLLTGSDAVWSYEVARDGRTYRIAPPTLELDGQLVKASVSDWTDLGERKLPNGTVEHIASGTLEQVPGISLEVTYRIAEESPVVRFRYRIVGDGGALTKTEGRDHMVYAAVELSGLNSAKEVRVSEFLEPIHSFSLSELPLSDRDYANGRTVIGPMVTASGGGAAALLAYEHGSQVPDAFVQFRLSAGGRLQLEAVKGNYLSGHDLAQEPFDSIWLQFAAVASDEDELARAYRTFVLKYMSGSGESRKPYIFYNTWNFQERDFNWHGRKYLANLKLDYILDDIDAAHRMGIDVYVIDTGWYEKTGDWDVNLNRFPDGLKQVKEKLDGYGMKLGLWFGPTSAALSSRMLQDNRDCVMTWEDKEGAPHAVWETEESHGMCLVSRYADAFADKLIELTRTLGVTYFKWDAIGQYGCSDPRHNHGTEANTEKERADHYAFRIGLEMSRIVEKLCEACPEAIVDFDVTEGSRFVGLGFLSAGKYFLINNGPYYVNYDLPSAPRYNADNPEEKNWNLFFYPGPARTWICRTPLTFDKWIPSVLFLTHYYPDDAADNQKINVGSLILGQNGIWGDLKSVSEEGTARIRKLLDKYKEVRDDITAAPMIRQGSVGGNPEIYEKIDPRTGRGAVVIFASSFGKPFSVKLKAQYAYTTSCKVNRSFWHDGEGINVRIDDAGHAVIETEFDEPSARIVYFGASSEEGQA